MPPKNGYRSFIYHGILVADSALGDHQDCAVCWFQGITAKVVQAPDFQWGSFLTRVFAESWVKSFHERTAFLQMRLIRSTKTSTSKPSPSPEVTLLTGEISPSAWSPEVRRQGNQQPPGSHVQSSLVSSRSYRFALFGFSPGIFSHSTTPLKILSTGVWLWPGAQSLSPSPPPQTHGPPSWNLLIRMRNW